MINPRIAISLATVAATASLVVGSTFAFFTDSGTSSNNSFSPGTFDLKLANGGGPVSDNVTATFGASNMKPGDCSGTQTLTIKNNGSVNAGHVKISVSNDNTVVSQFLRINSLTYGAANLAGSITDLNANPGADLDDFQAVTLTPFDMGSLASGVSTTLVMDVCLKNAATKEVVGGQTDNLTVTVQLDQ